MWFLLRSGFWFSFIWAALPGAAVPDTGATTQQALAGLQSLCAANSKQCLNALSNLAELNPSAIPASILAPQKPAAKLTTTKGKIAEVSKAKKTGTLTAQDLQPQWHSPKG